MTAIELLLKATLLKPVVHGLVHSEGLAEIIVQQSLSQPGFDRYSKLLTKLFLEMAGVDINAVHRPDATESLLQECTAQQSLRNKIIHQGAVVGPEHAERAREVSVAVYEQIVCEMLAALQLKVIVKGEIVATHARRL